MKPWERPSPNACDAFWCGVCTGLATWPLAILGALIWQIVKG